MTKVPEDIDQQMERYAQSKGLLVQTRSGVEIDEPPPAWAIGVSAILAILGGWKLVEIVYWACVHHLRIVWE